MFGGKSHSATNISKDSTLAVDMPHGAGPASYAIASAKGECKEWARMKGKVRTVLLFHFFLSLPGSGL